MNRRNCARSSRIAALILLLALSVAALAPSALAALQQGDENKYVLKVQKQLKSLGYFGGKCDGVFGADLKSAVKLFQEANGLKVTGEVGTDSRTLLDGGKALNRKEYDRRRALKLGDSGEAVKLLQKQLKNLGYYDGEIDGKYGDGLKSAVSAMQKANKLKATGSADFDTRKLLNVGKPKSASPAPAKPVPTQPAPAQPAPAQPKPGFTTLKKGNSGAIVKNLQTKLNELKYFPHKVNSKFDANTVEAVRQLQACNGLAVTGQLDEPTHLLLLSGKAITKTEYDYSKPVAKGDSGDPVKALQARLRDLKYYANKITGKYDQATFDAVKAFQSAHDLSATGKADADTRKLMNGSHAKSKQEASKLSAAATVAPAPPTPPPPTPAPTPKPGSTTAPPAAKPNSDGVKKGDKIETVIAAAKKQLGKPYVFSSTGPNSFDCSGLTTYAFKQVSISLPRTAHLQGYQKLTRLKRSELKRGDLVCFDTRPGTASLSDHVGIYLGGGEYIHASSSLKKVVIADITKVKSFSWGLRIIQ